jgi:Domain of unknown function (DUF4157)
MPANRQYAVTRPPARTPAAAVGPQHEARVAAIETARRPGAALPLDVQYAAARRYGHSFSHIRIHADGQAAAAAASLHAAAFTIGSDIVFGADRYAPASASGRLLLQHELRHVAQQHPAAAAPLPEIDQTNSPHERDARSMPEDRIALLPVQRIQRFSIGEDIIGPLVLGPTGSTLLKSVDADTIGQAAFGKTGWAFLKAVFEGFVAGFAADVKSGRADQAREHLEKLLLPWNAAKFYAGYLVGLLLGLISPITDLVKGIIGAVRLAASAIEWLDKWSPAGIAASPERQQKIRDLYQKFTELGAETQKSLAEFASDPKGTINRIAGFLDSLMQMALGKAREFGVQAAHSIFDFLDRDYYDLGEGVGEVIGALIAQILLVVFSDAIGNLIAEGASLLGKAAEFAAGKAVEVFEWVKGFAAKVVALLRNAGKGALKFFEGLVNKAVEAFDALAALFTEAEALGAGGERVAAGVGRDVGGALPNVMESRMVSGAPTAPAKVSDLIPPKVHPSKAGALTGSQTPAAATRQVVPPDIDQAVEGGIIEEPHATDRPVTRPRPARPTTRGAAAAARSRFASLRDGYARRLGVRSGDVHHAIELQVLDKYPGAFTETELNAFENMRGIPQEVGGLRQLHGSKIREIINRHYRTLDAEIRQRGLTVGTVEYNNLVRSSLLESRAEIDYLLGQFTTEQRATVFP